MNNFTCVFCGRKLNPTEINKKATVCQNCFGKARVEKIQTEGFLKENFTKTWSVTLFKNYVLFLKELGISITTICRHTSKVLQVLQTAENELLKPSDINEGWLVSTLEKIPNSKGVKSSLFNFLIKEGYLSLNADDGILTSIREGLKQVPKGFIRLLEIYFNEKMELRNRQVKFNARKPLSLLTVKADIEIFVRLVRWFQINCKDIESWDTVQQEDVHEFLLTLTPKHREIVRKDLLVLFKLAKRKRIITHIPILDIKSRELPPTIEPLTFDEQVRVARLIKISHYEQPLECLLTTLCLYHGLSSSHIRNIKISDIKVDQKAIYINDRPPVYLSNDEMVLINEYITQRSNIRNVQNKTFLILSSTLSEVYQDRPINNAFIARKVKAFCGFTPKSLRITCFNMIASNFGPQLLVEGFGLSLTQASRYGKLEDYLLEEQIRSERNFIKENGT
ncbi:site-specific integrase [Peribacillus simplex]|uniref:Site-specific integrase n=2 Tax=Peribacillus TaxID=2675229 RepID=A0AA90T533_9BACI|nr:MULTISPECIES: site-specific integrase [Peribacillus]MDP1421683.1 site-specific integrase [Peribacillus simplex]MDP1454393.1 site-specific integrase [Peribacillus frigoritolerans]